MEKEIALHLVADMLEVFTQHKNLERAAQQEAYMRNQFPFFGLNKIERTALQKNVFKKYPLTTERDLILAMRLLWHYKERECKYAALDLGIVYKKLWTPALYDVIHECVITDSWWDTVDTLASHYMGFLVARYTELQPYMYTWIVDEYVWKRRVALLHQLKYKKATNVAVLEHFCILRMHEREFFIAKAIGWILREYSKTDPEWVRLFINSHKKSLQPLSVREGSKYC